MVVSIYEIDGREGERDVQTEQEYCPLYECLSYAIVRGLVYCRYLGGPLLISLVPFPLDVGHAET